MAQIENVFHFMWLLAEFYDINVSLAEVVLVWRWQTGTATCVHSIVCPVYVWVSAGHFSLCSVTMWCAVSVVDRFGFSYVQN